VELDPDYHLFRKVPLDQILPTTSSTRFGKAFTAVLPAGEAPDAYRKIQSVFESSFEAGERIVVVAGQFQGQPLAERCALILGSAATDPYVSAFLSAIEFPVRWTDSGFEVDGARYGDPGDAVLCTVAHPGVPGGGVTVVYANSGESVPSAFAIPMYDRSLVVFRNGRAVLKRDFERRPTVPVSRL
jgi:hypothetical protein